MTNKKIDRDRAEELLAGLDDFEHGSDDQLQFIDQFVTKAYQRGLEDAAGVMTKRCATWSEQSDMASPASQMQRSLAARAVEAQQGAWAIRAMIKNP